MTQEMSSIEKASGGMPSLAASACTPSHCCRARSTISDAARIASYQRLLRQYSYFCASKASKLSTLEPTCARHISTASSPVVTSHTPAVLQL